jgi:Glu-tRNA(Gln) amidotransferase subunit E-like FAD-binding protein
MIDIFKSYWTKTGTDSDEINKILNDKASENHFKEILEFIMNTRIAKIFTEIVEKIDVKALNINVENPDELIEMIKNPEHPTIKKIITKIQNMLKDKMKRGELTQQQITAEVEAIKAKVTSIFGNIFNDAMGLNRGETPAAVLVGNSPEARRQRMLARLQKKQRDKNSS